MKKLSIQIQKIAEAIIENLTDDEKAVLVAGTDEDKIAEIGDKVLNGLTGFSEKTKAKGRGDVYADLDTKLFSDTELEGIIGKEKFDKIKAAKGTDKHVQLSSAYKDAIKAIKAAKADADTPAEEKAYKLQLEKVQQEFEAAKVAHQEEIAAKVAEVTTKFEADILRGKLFNKAQGGLNLADDYSKDEEFLERMVVERAMEKATEKGFKIDPKKLTITKTDGTPHFVNGAKEYGIDDLFGEVVKENWKKKAEQTDTGDVTVAGKDKGGYMRQDPIAAASKSMLV